MFLWEQLPIEVRQEFNNNPHEFMKNGEQWLKDKIAKETPTQPQTTEEQEQPKGDE